MRRFAFAAPILFLSAVLAACGGIPGQRFAPTSAAVPPGTSAPSSPAPPSQPAPAPAPAPSPTPTPSNPSSAVEVLYVSHSNGTVSTYDVDPATGTTNAAGVAVAVAPQEAANTQLLSTPDDRVLYCYWADGANTHVWVFATDASGVPQLPALQKITLPYSWTELLIHPSGRFIYALENTTPPNEAAFDSQLVLLPIAADGQLKSPHVFQNFHDAYHEMDLYRISGDGTAAYLTSTVNFDGEESKQFERYTIDPGSGEFGPQTAWFGVDGFAGEPYFEAVVGDQYMVSLNYYDYQPQDSYIDVYANVPSSSTPLIHCTPAMLSICETGKYMRLDPSERFLFVNDPVAGSNDMQGKLRVLRIDTSLQRLDDTGTSLSYSGGTVVPLFSPDDRLVYLVLTVSTGSGSKALSAYKFDDSSGALQQGSVLQLGLNDVPFSALRK